MNDYDAPSKTHPSTASPGLRIFSKLVCGSTFFLIFAGSLVTSTGSGLAVPDWPLSYGMVFPPMVGGVFYEHGHRMIATIVGFLTLVLAVWLVVREKRTWVRVLGCFALAMVIFQGVLGGITVLYFLPTAVSVSHAVTAQTFLVMTIVLAYSLSRERALRKEDLFEERKNPATSWCIATFLLIYGQLILGAVMRHTGSGLAIPDFPTVGGSWLPHFGTETLYAINDWRFEHDLPSITSSQCMIHFAHRIGALFILFALIGLNVTWYQQNRTMRHRRGNIWLLNFFFFVQVLLGAFTIWSQKAPMVTSLHVTTGAFMLGVSSLFSLRCLPTTRRGTGPASFQSELEPISV